MEQLNNEVEGALITQKIRGESVDNESFLPTTTAFHVDTKSRKPNKTATKRLPEPFCAFCAERGHWAQDCKQVTSVTDRIEKLTQSSRCFLCLNRGHSVKNCSKRGKSVCTKCRKSHHYSICTAADVTTPSFYKIVTENPDYTHLQTARVRLAGPTGLSRVTHMCFYQSRTPRALFGYVCGQISYGLPTFCQPEGPAPQSLLR